MSDKFIALSAFQFRNQLEHLAAITEDKKTLSATNANRLVSVLALLLDIPSSLYIPIQKCCHEYTESPYPFPISLSDIEVALSSSPISYVSKPAHLLTMLICLKHIVDIGGKQLETRREKSVILQELSDAGLPFIILFAIHRAYKLGERSHVPLSPEEEASEDARSKATGEPARRYHRNRTWGRETGLKPSPLILLSSDILSTHCDTSSSGHSVHCSVHCSVPAEDHIHGMKQCSLCSRELKDEIILSHDSSLTLPPSSSSSKMSLVVCDECATSPEPPFDVSNISQMLFQGEGFRSLLFSILSPLCSIPSSVEQMDHFKFIPLILQHTTIDEANKGCSEWCQLCVRNILVSSERGREALSEEMEKVKEK
ncbi:hypothetical protein ADUPG1_013951 [Aduncisulcus paluster]|uniref:Ataxin-10 domain-containing protein n=1 Tax=Aduncisulcus paluster TaxID=2918883 RepID=A0ABQ5K544_9EUKA|nr:hypothetical protein ADUPG1_013951 [Aduncisulcus paluster]